MHDRVSAWNWMECQLQWRYERRRKPDFTMLMAIWTCPEVKVAVALLIETELWGFVTPKSVNVDDVKAAAAKVQPYYAVPTRFVTLEEMPHTR